MTERRHTAPGPPTALAVVIFGAAATICTALGVYIGRAWG